jgi:hypothetical protein
MSGAIDTSDVDQLFRKFFIDRPSDFFQQLEAATTFEKVGDGRAITILLEPRADMSLPIVRTTAVYEKPAQRFAKIHQDLRADIVKASGVNDAFNNAMLELYSKRYTKMRFHSDHALDLQPATHIAVYSCYDSAQELCDTALRRLIVQDKETGETWAIDMQNNSVIVFSLETNGKFLHKIVSSATVDAANETKWLGLTLRTSSTFVSSILNSMAMLNINGKELTLATEKQRMEFYRMRSQENSSTTFRYPQIDYTISPSDLLGCV